MGWHCSSVELRLYMLQLYLVIFRGKLEREETANPVPAGACKSPSLPALPKAH
jgi:hypothetical protein